MLPKIRYLPFYAISALPMPVLYLLSDLLFIVVYYLMKYRRNVVSDNIKKSFPQKPPITRRKIEKDFYRHFCDILVESIKTLTIGKKSAMKRLRIENPDLVEHYLSEKKNILLYTAHQGNWEWMIFLPLFFPYRSNTFYKPIKNHYFNGLFKIIRERFGVHCIESNKGYRTIIDLERKNVIMMNCIIGDQSPVRISAKHWCHFLNRETAFFVGAEKLAKKTGEVVLFPSFKKIRRGCYGLRFSLITDNPVSMRTNGIIEDYAGALENVILKSPELWLWSHRRWKLTAGTWNFKVPGIIWSI